jgi:transposase
MQLNKPHKNFRHVQNTDENEYSAVVYERKEKLEKYKKLREDGCSEKIILEILELSRAVYYRWKRNYKKIGLAGLENESKCPKNIRNPKWGPIIEKRVYHLRKKFPLWGKAKIAVRYKIEHNEHISQSTVGRIIKKLVNQNKIMPVRFMYGKKETKRRIFSGHAQRWKRTMKASVPGELIQVDHMSVNIPGYGELKHFNAICSITKYSVYQVYQSACSKNAADFLEHMKKEFPFSISSIQVDGGSEFMGEFEEAAAQSNIPLFVLPPRSPEYNCNVERGNGTAKYEFYAQYEAAPNFHMIRNKLQKFAHFYNKIRPHQGIGLLTPCQFFEVIKEEAQKSHML